MDGEWREAREEEGGKKEGEAVLEEGEVVAR